MNDQEIAAKLREARDLMNNIGEHWIQGSSAQFDDDGKPTKFCSIGAIRYVLYGDAYADPTEEESYLTKALLDALPPDYRGSNAADSIVRWNDASPRDWNDISSTFETAAITAESAVVGASS